MTFLILGLCLWAAVHFVPSLAQPWKQTLVRRFGDNAYKLGFTVLVICSLVLIVYGWRQVQPDYIYFLPAIVRPVAIALMILAFMLFGAAKRPSRIKSHIRHPMLSGVIVWSIAHLLVNGDSRSIVLFGALGCWAVLEIILINRREGVWCRQSALGWKAELKGLSISLIVFVGVVIVHPFITGLSI